MKLFVVGSWKLNFLLMSLLLSFSLATFSQTELPHLSKKGNATQLIVDGKPFLILGGELGNSTATTRENMVPVWPKLKSLNLNTVLIPVYWELVEREEGKFDFSLYEDLILEARHQQLKLIFLWFGSWKNSMSSHVPAWVKLNQAKYPRVKDENGHSQEILSPFSQHVLQADKKAFENFVGFVKKTDATAHTVIMIQVENEIGMLPSARDYQDLAETAFKKDVPQQMINYLEKNKELLVPEFLQLWKLHGYNSKGSWEELFGEGLHTDEIFMAWYYAKFSEELVAAGKKIYDIPMFVNAALIRKGREPGQYPSAGPLPHLMDVWKAAAPSIDFLSPDFYNPDFQYWCDLYVRQGDPLFVPEHGFDQSVAAKALYTFGNYEGLGFSPFSIESKDKPEEEDLGKAYRLIDGLSPLFSKYQGEGKIKGVLLSKSIQETKVRLGKYELSCKHDYTLSWTPGARTANWPLASIIIIQTGEDEFYVSGTGVVITFKQVENKELNVGLLKVDEGSFEKGEWKIRRHLNGDQTHQGRHVSIPIGNFSTQKVHVYQYE